MSYAAYAAIPAVNWSTLKAMRQSPKHYLYAIEHPREDTPAMLLGRAVHAAVLEPDAFPLSFVVWDGARRGNAWTEFAAANAGRDILTVTEYEKCLAIRDAVRSHDVAGPLLVRGEAEKTITWTDATTGLACKGRLDFLTGRTIVDLKTTKDITPRAFGRTCDYFRYPSQLGFYRDGVEASTDLTEVGARLIAVESEAPHDVAVYKVSGDDLWRGSDEAHGLLERLAECMESDEWPGAYPERVELELPPWTWGEDTDLSGLGIRFEVRGAS